MAGSDKDQAKVPKIYKDRQFRLLIEQSADVIQLVSPDGDILYSSDSVVTVLGYTPEEIQGVNAWPYIHPEDIGAFNKKWQKLLKKAKARDTLEYRVKHKDGSWVWLETTVTSHLSTPGIEAIVGNFRNITERKEAEVKLRESEEQYRLLSDLSPEAIAVHSDGTILYVNLACAKLLGASSPKQIIGQPVMKFVHPDFVESVKKRIKVTLATRKPTVLAQEKFLRLDGQVIDVEAIPIPFTYRGKPAIQSIFRDITEHLRTIEALRKSEERLRFMAESMPQKIFTATADGELDYCNFRWQEFTGVHAAQLFGNGWMDFIHPDDLEDSISRWQYSLQTGDPFSFEQRFRRYDGVYRWHISRALPMRDEQGVIIRWFGSSTDIHDIRLAIKREHELESRAVKLIEQRTQLVALNEAKDEFIALASHQLRTPATVVKQYLTMVLDGYAGELTAPQREMVHNANISNERQISIINDLLEVARLDSGKIELHRQDTDIWTLVQQVVKELQSSIVARQQKITLVSQSNNTNAYVDPTKIRMVMENIINNASKYSMEKKAIKITISETENLLYVAVRDHGVGIGKKDQEKLFKKFSRLDNPLSVAVGGTGLGLYWASRIVVLHGGTIEVDSKLDKGSTFTIILPRNGRKI